VPGEFGTHVEIQALSEFFGRPVEIYSDVEGNGTTITDPSLSFPFLFHSFPFLSFPFLSFPFLSFPFLSIYLSMLCFVVWLSLDFDFVLDRSADADR